jgi:radical SAM protein with 4Fe4S-binding SPASM domain
LREDLPDLAAAVLAASPQAELVVSTSGLTPKNVRESIPNLASVAPTVGIAISLDGCEVIHNLVRGDPCAWRKTMESIEHILEFIPAERLRIAFTASHSSRIDNVTELANVYHFARSIGAQFTCAVSHASNVYFGVPEAEHSDLDTLKKQLDEVITEELMLTERKHMGRAYFYHGLLNWATTGRRLFPCNAGSATVMITPDGDIYPCNGLDVSMGNLITHSLEDVWQSTRAYEVRGIVRRCHNPCWMVCTARDGILKRQKQVQEWARNALKQGR